MSEGIDVGVSATMSASTLAKLKGLHRTHSKGRLVWLSGAGVSIPAGLPSWNEFNTRIVARLIRHAHRMLPLDPGEAGAIALRFVERFGRDAVPDLVRQQLAVLGSSNDYERWLADALYADSPELEPSEAHMEIAAAAGSGVTFTFNFDELIEAAGRKLDRAFGVWLSGVTPPKGACVAHLHGVIPREGPVRGQIVLSERDYHLHAGRWGHTKLRDLIVENGPEHHVLLIGLSIADPRLRSALLERLAKKASQRVKITALLTCYQNSEPELAQRLTRTLVRDYERAYWKEWDIDTLFMEHHELLPYVLRCVRLGPDGAAWTRKGASALRNSPLVSRPGISDEQLWQQFAENLVAFLRRRCAVPGDEQLELGAFVPERTGALRWAYHWSSAWDRVLERKADPSPYEGPQRRLAVEHLGRAQGAAGYAFLTGASIEAGPGSRFLDRNFDSAMAAAWRERKTFRSVVCVPVYGTRELLPLGVVYLSSNRDVPFWKSIRGDLFDDLQALLTDTWYKLALETVPRIQ